MVRFIIVWVVLLGSLWAAQVERKVPVLCYHRFSSGELDSMSIKTAVFEEQMAWLKTSGYTVVSLDTAMQYIQGKIKSIPAKSVVITVDDGHKSVLQRYGTYRQKIQDPCNTVYLSERDFERQVRHELGTAP
jgi:hypothetical protein